MLPRRRGERLRVLRLALSIEWAVRLGDHAKSCAAQPLPAQTLTVLSVTSTDGLSACHVCGQDLI